MTSNLTTWLEEGMRHYAAGDPARALESWYRILEVEPQNRSALQYVAFVRQAFRLDGAAPSTTSTDPPAPDFSGIPGFSAPGFSAPTPTSGAPAPGFSGAPPVLSASSPPAFSPGADEFAAPAPRFSGWVASEPSTVEQASGPAPVRGSISWGDLVSTEPGPAPSVATPADLFDIDVVDAPPVSAPSNAGPGLDEPPTRSTDAFVEGPVRQSTRFEEPPPRMQPAPASASFGAPPKTDSLWAVAHSLPPPTSPEADPRPISDEGSPWDSHDGPGLVVAVDTVQNPQASAFESLLKRASGASVAAVEIAHPLTATPTEPEPLFLPEIAKTNPPLDECEALMAGARELFELGDFSGSLELVEKVIKRQPLHEGARAYLKRNEQTLLKMYESKLGDMRKVPRQLVPPDEVIWMNMHHRAGFILSQVDGSLSYDDILEVSGMDRFDSVRIIADLVGNGIIG